MTNAESVTCPLTLHTPPHTHTHTDTQRQAHTRSIFITLLAFFIKCIHMSIRCSDSFNLWRTIQPICRSLSLYYRFSFQYLIWNGPECFEPKMNQKRNFYGRSEPKANNNKKSVSESSWNIQFLMEEWTRTKYNARLPLNQQRGRSKLP